MFIAALGEKGEKGDKHHIPYRNSKVGFCSSVFGGGGLDLES